MSKEVEFKFEVLGTQHEFRVESFNVVEEVSQPFKVTLSLLSLNPDIEFDVLSRKPALLTVLGQGMDVGRLFHGVVHEVRYLGEGRRFSRYQITLVPQLWFLTQRQDCRIFQDKSIVDILTEVLDSASVTDYRFELFNSYPNQDYLLQYRETDSHFVQRLLAEHGLWYYFEHTANNHTMVIVDKNDAIPELVSTPLNASYVGPLVYQSDGGGNSDREHIFELSAYNRVRTGHVTQTDYNYEQPRIPQHVQQQGERDSDLAFFDYPGRYGEIEQGQQRSNYLVAEHQVYNHQIDAESNIMRLIAGYSFNLTKHPRSTINRDYILTSVTHSGYDPRVHEEESSELPTTYQNQFTCIPRDVEYKANKLSAPVVDGPQTAVVVGPAGEEIYTDPMGRIKVQFHWDRYGNNDEHSGCWLRVSQSMAAPTWGAVYLPRIGHEVVVTFLEGDPDRPLVTGAVYNGLNTPPYALPEHKTKTVFRTQTHKGEGYNEMSFEDEANQEEVYFHAQKDMRTKVLNNRFRTIGNDEELEVGRNQINEINQDRKETIEGHKTSITNQTFEETVEQDVNVKYNANIEKSVAVDQVLKIYENRKSSVGKNDELTIKGEQSTITMGSMSRDISADDTLTVGKNLTVEVGSNASIKSDGDHTIISADEISAQVGSSGFILKNNGTITLYGSDIMVDGASSVALAGGNVAINPSAAQGQSSSVSINPPRAFSMSPLASTKPVMNSAAYSEMVEEGSLMKELCQCGKGGVCQLHS
ncbi:type VI secretion system tip protein TssI/VgrG [Aliivibrio sifiae]|uniref:Type VI secretion protein VgrG n=1 Tax=Aliivibrio sifiae TaxID=566293 RepID=A0A2S7XI66_9GAMM|nr:type VI secretion system tip protein TssI/VgrG [Aliivibrio sifiae]PQJ93356.1 type VI secretion protein VgrG [Aliivibrio sifiae]GLR74563.1 type VI secretion protein VgrG [Aliivibrio sifiae]